ncbi:MAG: hypothetical protein GY936_02280 [Ignavibacteriae bacterium]|nr:hypothetical protein [Ignavibacteriota bacterium]
MKNLLKQILLILIFFTFSNLFAQYDYVRKNSFTYPNRMSYGEWKHYAGLTLAKLPEDAVEEASVFIYAPLLNYKTKVGLGWGFSGNGSFNTNGITYHFYAGYEWAYRLDRVSLSIGAGPAYFAGKLNAFGFDSKVKGWLGYNYYSLGIALNKYTVTFKLEQNFNISITQYSDDIDIKKNQAFIAEVAFSVTIEQPLWKDNFWSLGLRANYSKFYYPVWAVFPTWDRYSLIPEVVIGFVL